MEWWNHFMKWPVTKRCPFVLFWMHLPTNKNLLKGKFTYIYLCDLKKHLEMWKRLHPNQRLLGPKIISVNMKIDDTVQISSIRLHSIPTMLSISPSGKSFLWSWAFSESLQWVYMNFSVRRTTIKSNTNLRIYHWSVVSLSILQEAIIKAHVFYAHKILFFSQNNAQHCFTNLCSNHELFYRFCPVLLCESTFSASKVLQQRVAAVAVKTVSCVRIVLAVGAPKIFRRQHKTLSYAPLKKWPKALWNDPKHIVKLWHKL